MYDCLYYECDYCEGHDCCECELKEEDNENVYKAEV